MKDFYRILGVKENASEEEIRERWIELTKHYHPDRGVDIASEEKIREINEAYQVLKHSSTRIEYDLNRAYGPQNREGKRKSYFKRFIIPGSMLIIILILSVLYFQNFQNQINQTNQKDQTDQTNQINQIDKTDQINQRDMPAQPSQIAAVTPAVSIVFTQRHQKDQTNQRNQTDQTDQRNQINQTDQTDQRNQRDMPAQPSQIAAVTPAVPIVFTQRNQKDQINQIDQINQTDQKDQGNQMDVNIELAQFKPPSVLATEDEVKKFFKDYIERYDRMDIEGFLSLFSPKAIQNQKDRFEGIRKIYLDFFKQGEKVRYRTQDMKVEIYQNAVEVKARYEIVQTLKTGGGEQVWRGDVRWVLNKENGALKILSLDYQQQ